MKLVHNDEAKHLSHDKNHRILIFIHSLFVFLKHQTFSNFHLKKKTKIKNRLFKRSKNCWGHYLIQKITK